MCASTPMNQDRIPLWTLVTGALTVVYTKKKWVNVQYVRFCFENVCACEGNAEDPAEDWIGPSDWMLFPPCGPMVSELCNVFPPASRIQNDRQIVSEFSKEKGRLWAMGLVILLEIPTSLFFFFLLDSPYSIRDTKQTEATNCSRITKHRDSNCSIRASTRENFFFLAPESRAPVLLLI